MYVCMYVNVSETTEKERCHFRNGLRSAALFELVGLAMVVIVKHNIQF